MMAGHGRGYQASACSVDRVKRPQRSVLLRAKFLIWASPGTVPTGMQGLQIADGPWPASRRIGCQRQPQICAQPGRRPHPKETHRVFA